LPKAHRSLQPRGVSTPLEALSLSPNYLITDAYVDQQQQKLQGDTLKKNMSSKCHRRPIQQARSWDFSRRDFKMIGSATSRQRLQQGKVAKYWIESLAPHQASSRHRNHHTPRAVCLTPTPGLQSCCPPHRSNTMAETHTEAEAHRSLSFRKQLPSMP
jgi:hypothetical protein